MCVSNQSPAPGQCGTTPGGNTICVAQTNSPTPDRPTQGGNPLNPDGITQITTGTNTTNIENYNNTTNIDNPAPPLDDGTGDGTGGECDPATEQCEDGGGGGGGKSDSCDVEPSCTDAASIQCAILRQQHADTCRTFDIGDATGLDLRQQVGLTGAGVGALDPDEQAAVDELKEEIDLSIWRDMFLPGVVEVACPPGLSFTALGETYELSLEPTCEFLRYLSVLVVISSTLAAFRIAFA